MKTPFIHPDWQRRLETVSRASEAIPVFETRLKQMENFLMATIEQLRAEVARNTTVAASAVTLINGLVAKIREAEAAMTSGNSGALATLVAEIAASTNALAEAVATNTAVEYVDESPSNSDTEENEPDEAEREPQ